MKKWIFLSLFTWFLIPGHAQDLIGKKPRYQLQGPPYNSWFTPNYEEFTPDAEIVKKLKPLMEDYTITIFMGTWCEDSQREVPHFFKLMDDLEFNSDKITIIGVNRRKTTPDGSELGHNITNVPTFIFYKNGKEINRIVEFPIESLEADILQIVSGQEYKHAYEY